MSCPAKKSWKFRCRSDLNAPANLDCGGDVLSVAMGWLGCNPDCCISAFSRQQDCPASVTLMILTVAQPCSDRSTEPSSRNFQMNLPTNAVVLKTSRLILRPLRRDDIPQLLPLIGAREVAATTLRIPHHYIEEDALRFLEYSDSVWAK